MINHMATVYLFVCDVIRTEDRGVGVKLFLRLHRLVRRIFLPSVAVQ